MERDLVEKDFFSDNARYADFINGIAAHGETMVRAEDLAELDTELHIRHQKKRKKAVRDLVRRAAFGVHFAIIGIENQEKIDYTMPYRTMLSDIGQYGKQITSIRRKVRAERGGVTEAEYLCGFQKGMHLEPTITFVIYYGEQEWDGERDLYGMLDLAGIPKELQALVQNYKLHLIEVRKLEDTSVFHTDVRQVFDFIRYSNDAKKLKELIANDAAYQELDEDAFDMIASYSRTENLLERKEEYREGEKIKMCKAIDDMMKESEQLGIELGRNEGIELGRNEGIEEARKKMVADFLINGGTEEDAKRMLKATEEEIAGAKELLQTV